MRLLVLGGTHHVGRAVVSEALARGDHVTTLTRGISGPSAPAADARHADRTDPEALAAALADDEWDAVVDTWSFAPAHVQAAARLLAGRARHYTYVSSRSVYGWPIPSGADESAPVVAGEADSLDAEDYAAAKRGGELAALEFDGTVLVARPGLILGPWELVGRLPFWLRRLAAGGVVPVPGPRERPVQYIDARDLASWLLTMADAGRGGVFNTVSEPGHTTMGALIEAANAAAGGSAELVWVTPEQVAAAGVAPWTELPIWLPPTGEFVGLHDGDVGAALAAGLSCRPMAETVADTWDWLQSEGDLPHLADPRRDGPGFDEYAERRLLEAAERWE